MRALPLLLLLAALGCRSKDLAEDTGPAPGPVDADGDGYDAESDCDDGEAAVNPGAAEQPYDGLDNDCDPATADDDLDGDGFGVAEDCDDGEAAVNPAAEERCDGVDEDCDGQIDDDAVDGQIFYADADGDGYGAEAYATRACEAPEGHVAAGGDCDDRDVRYNPGAEESDCADPNDYNCDGSVGYADNDGDGYAACEECDDSRAAVNPGAVEVCNDLDDDCDGEVDAGAVDALTFYMDGDGDGYGDADFTLEACEAPTGYAANDDDCDDGAAEVNPGAAEVCNDLDDDCDGRVDVGATDAPTWYGDGDGDGYGNAALTRVDCDQPSGYVANADDCDDGEALAWTGASEACDEVDNDCDGGVDEGVTLAWYADVDGDGYGSSALSQQACTQPSGYAAASGDCDEGDVAINPGAAEVCDGVDNDCDGATDDADASVDTSTGATFYGDGDADGFGDAASALDACEAPSGYVGDGTDCDDAEPSTYPGAAELCDLIDNDCDGVADGGLLGADPGCAAESCLEILADGSATGDGQYYLDPEGDGAPALYDCDMGTDGGGWTLVTEWNREDDGDGVAELQAEMTELTNTMGLFDTSNASYLVYNDYDVDSDVLAYEDEVEVPNGGEVLMDIHFSGRSMECSGVWFYVEDASANPSDLYCREDLPPNCSHITSPGTYSSAELAWAPAYTCAETADDNWSWEEVGQFSTGAEVTRFNWRGLMWDANGDFAYVYRFAVWVR